MKKILIAAGAAVLVLAAGMTAFLYFSTDFFGETEYDKKYLLKAIEKTSDLDAAVIETTGSMSDENEGSSIRIESEFLNKRGKVFLTEKSVVTNTENGLVTKQYVITKDGTTKYKIVQNGADAGWQEKDNTIDSVQGMSLLTYTFAEDDMDLISAENDGDYIKFQLRFNNNYAEKMAKRHKGEIYDIKEYRFTYWVNDKDMVVRCMTKQHVIYNHGTGDIDMTYEHDAKLKAYGEKAEKIISGDED
ncbi:MAG: hypothetical protein ACI4LO_03340 [Anaerovoracaceae bacterium]